VKYRIWKNAKFQRKLLTFG